MAFLDMEARFQLPRNQIILGATNCPSSVAAGALSVGILTPRNLSIGLRHRAREILMRLL
jgi:hypothetical protein